jgi:mRNA deadenylase 3'-5' endonuclease subunit Ccr4
MITVGHWNILANWLCTEDSFPKASSKALENERRNQLQRKIIAEKEFDFLCLCEVDTFPSLNKFMKTQGYQGIYQQKQGEDSHDGSAIFYQSKYDLVEKQVVKYGGSQIGLVALFEMKTGIYNDCDKKILVATTHLKAKPGYEELRLEQLNQLLKVVDQYDVDFNDVPDSLIHQRMLDAAYNNSHVYEDGSYTTYKIRERAVCRVIDYIWKSPSNIQCSKSATPK